MVMNLSFRGKVVKVLKYEIPKCNCGGDLIYDTEHVFKIRAKINKDGTISKSRKIEMELGTLSVYGVEHLLCKSCLNIFIFDYDKRNRISKVREIW